MIKTSEFCAVGHPDRTCDYIASYLLDRYLEKDPYVRVALEVQLKDTFCTVSGEVSSHWNFTDEEIAAFCLSENADPASVSSFITEINRDSLECTAFKMIIGKRNSGYRYIFSDAK